MRLSDIPFSCMMSKVALQASFAVQAMRAADTRDPLKTCACSRLAWGAWLMQEALVRLS